MLVLRRKERERIFITVGKETIVVTVTGIERNTVRLGFECGPDVNILREELYNKEKGYGLLPPESQDGGG